MKYYINENIKYLLFNIKLFYIVFIIFYIFLFYYNDIHHYFYNDLII